MKCEVYQVGVCGSSCCADGGACGGMDMDGGIEVNTSLDTVRESTLLRSRGYRFDEEKSERERGRERKSKRFLYVRPTRKCMRIDKINGK